MRKLVILITAALPVVAAAPVQAEQVVVRIEAKRGPQTQAVVDGWAQRLPGVVTFALPGGWTGIGIGPMERADAQTELARLKAAGTIPDDSFIAPAPNDVTAAQGTPPGAPAADAASPASSVPPAGPAAAASTFVAPDGAMAAPPAVADAAPEPAEDSAADAAPVPAEPALAEVAAPAVTPPDAASDAAAVVDGSQAGDQPAADQPPAADPVPAGQADAQPAGDYLRLQRFDTRASADEALAQWRAQFPEAGLFQQPDGAYAVVLGPLPAPTAEAWLGAFRAADRVGKSAAVIAGPDVGQPVEAASPIDLPGPGTASMPPLEEVQRALRWAGHYDGRIDGKDGPQTRAAIAAEVLSLRAAPDAPSAMQALIDRRTAWRARMGLTRLDDAGSGLSVMAPMDRLQFDRNDHGLSIYGPRDGSGAALILYSAPGGQQEMLDFAGLVTALGWVPSPERNIAAGHASLRGRNDTHIGQAEARVTDGRVEGMVLIWPVMDEADQPRIAAELIDSLSPVAAAQSAPATEEVAAGAAVDAADTNDAAGLPGGGQSTAPAAAAPSDDGTSGAAALRAD